jgi:hypothetical protein
VQLSTGSGNTTQFIPDLRGNYIVQLLVTDPSGASAVYTTTIAVNNTRPIASIVTSTTPSALPSGPAVRVPVGTQVTLRGSGSSDADGDVLSYAWTVTSRPNGSTAQIAANTAVNVQFTPDRAGSYVLSLRVTDASGAYSERALNIETGNYAPVAVTDKSRVTVVAGTSVSASAELSFDEEGDPLTFSWAVDARPTGSTANVAGQNTPNVAFTPDLPGTYVLSVTVNDGDASNVGYVTIRALSNISSSVALSFVPIEAVYSKGLDRLVILAGNPNSLRIVDPFTGSIKSVTLPAAVKAFDLSPDGKLAGVLHEGTVSLVDLETAQLVRTTLTSGSQTDVFILNDSVAYLIGQSGGQWVDSPITTINTRTGAAIPQQILYGGGARFYGTQKGVFADRKNKVLFMAYGLSPADISSFSINPATYAVTATGESPYHGHYNMGSTFYLSGNQELLFTSAGNFFYTDTLTYGGSLGLTGGMLAMSHSSEADEALILEQGMTGNYPYTSVYKPSYKRLYGSLFLHDADLSLPTIGGEQSYGMSIFHSANGNHIVLVQTGSAEALHSNARYHVIHR